MISLIIITFNRAGFLEKTLQALTTQKKKADEIIVVDNGSQDLTRKIVQKYQKELPLKYILEKRKGYARARNAGIREAKGSLICFLDDDCLPIKNWLIILEKEINQGHQVVGGSKIPQTFNFFSQIDYFITAAPILHPKLKRQLKSNLSTSNLAICKGVFKQIGLFNEKLSFAEDRDFLLRAQAKGLKLLFCPRAKVYDIGSPRNAGSFGKRMISYGSGIMSSYLTQKDKEPLSKFFPKNQFILTVLAPFFVIMETAYTVSRNFKTTPQVIFFIPFIFLALIFWHYGLILGLKNVR